MAIGFLLGMIALPQAAADASGINSVQASDTGITIRFDDAVERATSFVLAAPNRIAIDVVGADPGPAAQWNGTAVTRVRQGRPDASTTRIVLDLDRPVLPSQGRFSGDGKALSFILAPASGAEFEAAARRDRKTLEAPIGAFAKPPKPRYSVSTTIDPAVKRLPRTKIYGPAGRPLIVIDAGHGGHDPGAISPLNGTREKDVTLATALAIRDELIAAGRFRVALTRADDRFLVLGERSVIAKSLGAALFISIHADSAGSGDASGATIYTLSETASDAAAAKLAARENKADVLNGVNLGGESPEIASILVDLAQRETINASANFANLLRREASRDLNLRGDYHRMAGFAVLKQPDMPAILLEIGYLTHQQDADRITSREGQRRIAQGIRRAIDIHLAQRLAQR